MDRRYDLVVIGSGVGWCSTWRPSGEILFTEKPKKKGLSFEDAINDLQNAFEIRELICVNSPAKSRMMSTMWIP